MQPDATFFQVFKRSRSYRSVLSPPIDRPIREDGNIKKEPPVESGGDLMTNWETCPAVESVPGRLSGAWVFTGTRLPVSALFENLESGATRERFMEWFEPVDEWKVRAVLQHVADSLKLPVPVSSLENTL